MFRRISPAIKVTGSIPVRDSYELSFSEITSES